MHIEFTSHELHSLLFNASSSSSLDAERSHFIRRTQGNSLAYCVVISHALAQRIKDQISSEHFHLQFIHADGFLYAVLWERTDWELSGERKRLNREKFLQQDVESLKAKAIALRLELVFDELLKVFDKDSEKAMALALSITTKPDHIYKAKADTLEQTCIAGFSKKVKLYYPLSSILAEIDHRNILPSHEKTEDQSNQSSNDSRDSETSTQSSAGIG